MSDTKPIPIAERLRTMARRYVEHYEPDVSPTANLLTSAADAIEALDAACKAYAMLFNTTDMRPENECHELYGIIAKALEAAGEPTP